jgi:D-glycero-D-manno-heptose 1,7-bisphosphate phosphatase
VTGLVILDRDGVINEDSDQYIRSLDEWHPIPGSIEAIARLSQAGLRVAVATNQSGLSRGYFDLDDLEAIHAELCARVEAAGGRIDAIAYCPHLPTEDCDCRKPRTGLLEALKRELALPLTGAPFIGDSLKDLQAAEKCGCRPMLVTTGKGTATRAALDAPDVDLQNPGAVAVFTDLAAAVAAILEHS